MHRQCLRLCAAPLYICGSESLVAQNIYEKRICGSIWFNYYLNRFLFDLCLIWLRWLKCLWEVVYSSSLLRSRGSTFRSPSAPLGRQDSQAVRDGTILACRALILLLVASCRGCWWCLEQPISSCMEHLPCFQHLLRILEVRKYTMSMADYGGPTEKRTIIYSSALYSSRYLQGVRFYLQAPPKTAKYGHLLFLGVWREGSK